MLERMVSPKSVWGCSGPSVRRFSASASSASLRASSRRPSSARGVGEVDHGQDRLVARRAEDAPLPLAGPPRRAPGPPPAGAGRAGARPGRSSPGACPGGRGRRRARSVCECLVEQTYRASAHRPRWRRMIARLYSERSVKIDSGPSTRRWISRVSSASLTASSSRPCMASTTARLFTDRSVIGSSGPRVRRLTATTSSRIFCSSANFPIRFQDDGEVVHRPDGLRVLRGRAPAGGGPAARSCCRKRLLLVAQVPVAHAEGVSDRRLRRGARRRTPWRSRAPHGRAPRGPSRRGSARPPGPSAGRPRAPCPGRT